MVLDSCGAACWASRERSCLTSPATIFLKAPGRSQYARDTKARVLIQPVSPLCSRVAVYGLVGRACALHLLQMQVSPLWACSCRTAQLLKALRH
jgi:hypothetical protein